MNETFGGFFFNFNGMFLSSTDVSTIATVSSETSFWFYVYIVSLIVIIFALAILFAERKMIAAAQKRLGISFLGRNG